MKKIDSFKGVKIEPDVEYFAQVTNIGIEGKIVGVKQGKLVMEEGREFDLREVVALGYEATQKYDFDTKEVPTGSIRVFRKR